MGNLTRLETALLKVPLGEPRGGSGSTEVEVVQVTLGDEDGRTGTGFTYALGGGGSSVLAMIDSTFGPQVLGSEILAWQQTWEQLWSRTHRLGRGVAVPALSALDIALWDLRARAAEMPLYRLLGAERERVPVYGSGRATNSMTVEELIAGTQAYLDEGYRAVKLRVGTRPVEEEAARVWAIRDHFGSDLRIMVDCNEWLDYPQALWLGRRLSDLGVYWLEEPLVSDDLDGHRRLAEKLDLSIAVGEHLQGRFEFAAYMREGAASILQPDAPLVGGVTEWMRIATTADAMGATITPHLLPELHIHLCLAARSCIYIEHFPLLDDLFGELLVAEGGTMAAPDRPGHGIIWDAAAVERFTVAG
jgi:L-alanine-DL-glutamate epimerase-like enolase superfamily enzyme